MTDGLFETHLNVARLETSIAFYAALPGFTLAHRFDERRVAFFWIGGRGRSMIGLWQTGTAPNVMQLHTAFRCTLEDVLAAPARLQAAGITPLGFDGEAVTEPIVYGWMPAAAVFFRDPDGHLLEYIAMLPGEPRPDVGVVPYSCW